MRDSDETLPDDGAVPIDTSIESETGDAGDLVGPEGNIGLRAVLEEAESTRKVFSPEFVKMVGELFPEKGAQFGVPAGMMSMIGEVVSTKDWGLGVSAEAMSMFRDVAKMPDWLGKNLRAGASISDALSDATTFAKMWAGPPTWMAPAFRVTDHIDGFLADSAWSSASIRAVWNESLAAHASTNGAVGFSSSVLRPFLEDFSAPAWLGPVIDAAAWKPAFDIAILGPGGGLPPGILELFKQLPFPDLGLFTLRLPPNWRHVDATPEETEEKVKVILEDAIPLGWVPSARVIELLLAAPDRSARRRVIINNYRGILTDCEDILSGLSAPGALGYADSIRRAVRAMRDGHADAAQALASNVLETIVSHYTAKAATLAMPPSVLTNASSYKRQRKLGWRIFLSLYPLTAIMGGKHTPFTPTVDYRRNATVHAVTRQQYTRTNAVLAVMNATAVLTCYVRDTEAFD